MAALDVRRGAPRRHRRDVADAPEGPAPMSVVAPAPPRVEPPTRLRAEPTETVRVPRGWPLPIGVAATILAMFGPWLRSGVVLGLDSPVNLIVPYPRASITVV